MKRLYILFLCLAAISAEAQRLTHDFQNTSLSEALIWIDNAQDNYKLNFIFDELEDFTVTTQLKNVFVRDAVRQVCGFYPMHLTFDNQDIYIECMQKTKRHLKGTIIDEQGRPLAFANIAILNPADSTLLSGGVSNEGGQFVVPYEQYKVLVRISYMGYKSIFRLCTQEDMGTIRLQRDSYIVKGVEVKGSRPVFKMKNGALVAPIENTVLSKLGDGIDVLQQLPFINGDGSSVNVVGRQGKIGRAHV